MRLVFEIHTRFCYGGPDKQLRYQAFQLFVIHVSNGRLVKRLYSDTAASAFSFPAFL